MERLPDGLGPDHVADFSQGLDAARKRVAVFIDDPPQLPFKGGGLLV
jgi:hypothetical protein